MLATRPANTEVRGVFAPRNPIGVGDVFGVAQPTPKSWPVPHGQIAEATIFCAVAVWFPQSAYSV